MKTLLLSSLIAGALLVSPVIAQQHPAQTLGTMGVGVTGLTTTTAVNSTGPAWYAVSWVPLDNHTISKVKMDVNSVTGTIGASDMKLDIYSDSFGSPNALVTGCTTTTVTSVPTTAAFVEFTGFTCAVTQFTQYWFVLKNANTSGNAASWTMRSGAAQFAQNLNPLGSGSTYGSLMVASSANGGSTWTLNPDRTAFVRVEYNDSGTIIWSGNPLIFSGPIDATHQVFGTHETGTTFTMGAAAAYLRGIATPCGKHGNPTGNLQVKVYSGAWSAGAPTGNLTLAGTSNNLAGGYFGTSAGASCFFYFTTPLTLLANSTYTWALSDTATDSTTVYYAALPTFFDTDSHSVPLLPFGGSVVQSTCTGSCTSSTVNWSQIAGQYYPFQLLLDPAQEFVTPAAGGGPNGAVIVQ